MSEKLLKEILEELKSLNENFKRMQEADDVFACIPALENHISECQDFREIDFKKLPSDSTYSDTWQMGCSCGNMESTIIFTNLSYKQKVLLNGKIKELNEKYKKLHKKIDQNKSKFNSPIKSMEV